MSFGGDILNSILPWYGKKVTTDNLARTYPKHIAECSTVPLWFFEQESIPHVQGINSAATTNYRKPVLGPIYYDREFEALVQAEETKRQDAKELEWERKQIMWKVEKDQASRRKRSAPQVDQRIVSSMEKGKSNVPSNSPP